MELRDLHKAYGARHVVCGVSILFQKSKMSFVCGENGAGKSTLLKLAASIVKADRGDVILSPSERVYMVQQHLALIDTLTVLENALLLVDGATFKPTCRSILGGQAKLFGRWGRWDDSKARAKLSAAMDLLQFRIPLDTRVSELSLGERQRFELARALYIDAQTIILDEPSAVLTPQEATRFYTSLDSLSNEGRSIIVVTHRLGEIDSWADAVFVMHKGHLVYQEPNRPRKSGIQRITSAMMGEVNANSSDVMGDNIAVEDGSVDAIEKAHSVVSREERVFFDFGQKVLELKGVCGDVLSDFSLVLHAGEMVGIAGMEGSGQHELVQILSGHKKKKRGTLYPSPLESAETPMAVVFHDRSQLGLIQDATIEENLLLGQLPFFSSSFSGKVDLTRLRAFAEKHRGESNVNADLDSNVGQLSGGNQQKIVVQRALAKKRNVLILAEPTRGVDFAASEEIYKKIVDQTSKKRGELRAGVLVLSSDLQELKRICHKIMVLSKGRIVASLSSEASELEIGKYMLSLPPEQSERGQEKWGQVDEKKEGSP